LAKALAAGDASVLQTIAEEATAVRRFVDLLKLEQTSLSNGSTDDLLDFAEQKSKLATQLNSLAAQRSALLVAQGFSADRTGVDAWCVNHSSEKEAGATWSSLLSLAADARELNRLNGELIQMRMQYNANALEALRGGRNALDLYGPDGQSTSPSHRRINDTV
jgi:flagellar biosynthesis protein FlgN